MLVCDGIIRSATHNQINFLVGVNVLTHNHSISKSFQIGIIIEDWLEDD